MVKGEFGLIHFGAKVAEILCRGGIQPPSISQSDCVFLKMHSRSLEPSSIGFFCAIFDLQLLSMCPVSHLFDDRCQVALYDLYAWT